MNEKRIILKYNNLIKWNHKPLKSCICNEPLKYSTQGVEDTSECKYCYNVFQDSCHIINNEYSCIDKKDLYVLDDYIQIKQNIYDDTDKLINILCIINDIWDKYVIKTDFDDSYYIKLVIILFDFINKHFEIYIDQIKLKTIYKKQYRKLIIKYNIFYELNSNIADKLGDFFCKYNEYLYSSFYFFLQSFDAYTRNIRIKKKYTNTNQKKIRFYNAILFNKNINKESQYIRKIAD